MKFSQSLHYSFSFLLAVYTGVSLAENISPLDQFIPDYDCASSQEETESIFPAFDLVVESFDSELIAQFIEELPEEISPDDEEEENEELELLNDLDETYICDLEVLI